MNAQCDTTELWKCKMRGGLLQCKRREPIAGSLCEKDDIMGVDLPVILMPSLKGDAVIAFHIFFEGSENVFVASCWDMRAIAELFGAQ